MGSRFLLATVLVFGTAAGAEPGMPLSAIDWLSDSVAIPVAQPAPGRVQPSEPAISDDALPAPVMVAPLKGSLSDNVGVAPETLGLPVDLWRNSTMEDVEQRLAETRMPRLPAPQTLLRDLLVAAAPAPSDSRDGMEMFLARIDALLGIGRLDDARNLIEQAERETPQPFRRWFDITLLTGHENKACERMRDLPQITPTYPARVFCLARTGDWRAALVTLGAAERLELISTAEADRLGRFLDDLGGGTALEPPERPTPLDYMIYEAIGEPLRSTGLPIAFAHAELRANAGWRARLEGAERLTRAGAIPPKRLWRVYHEREPAASGGLWDRVAAVQAFDAALAEQDMAKIAEVLPVVWSEMQARGLAFAFAERNGHALSRMKLDGDAGKIALHASYLADVLPEERQGAGPDDAFLASLVRGKPEPGAAVSPEARHVADALEAPPPERVARLLEDGRKGEALLLAVNMLEDGATGSLDALRDGLATLVAAGQPDRAARAGLEFLLVEVHG